MESDADRLAMIKSLGGQFIRHASGGFWALFDAAFALSTDGVVETRQPTLTARTSDIAMLPKDIALEIAPDDLYRIKRHEPDGSGMSLVILKR